MTIAEAIYALFYIYFLFLCFLLPIFTIYFVGNLAVLYTRGDMYGIKVFASSALKGGLPAMLAAAAVFSVLIWLVAVGTELLGV